MPTRSDLSRPDGLLYLDRLDKDGSELMWGVGWDDGWFSSAIVRVRERPCFAEILPEHVAVGRPTDAWRQYLVLELTPEQFAEEWEHHPAADPAIPVVTADPSERRRQVRAFFERRERYGRRERWYGGNEVVGWLDGLPGTGLRRIIPRDTATAPGVARTVAAGEWPRPVPNRSRVRWIYD